MKIKLTNCDKETIIDDEDFEKLPTHNWRLNSYGYVVGFQKIAVGVYNRHSFLHRIITNCPKGLEVDHINGDKLDNRKSNLRIVTGQQNKMNRLAYKNNKLGLKGVCKDGKKYKATIKKNGIKKHIGLFNTPEEAARAYDKEAKKAFGEYARPNFE